VPHHRPPKIVTLTPNPALDVSTSVTRLQPFMKLRCAPARKDPGGGGINAARVIHRLRGDVRAVFPAGGAAGTVLGQLVHREGIDMLAVPVGEDTREDVTVFEEETGAQYRFVLPGPPLSSREWRALLRAFERQCEDAAHAVISGSLAPGMPEDFHARAAALAKAQGAKAVVDVSGPALVAALETGLFLIKPNIEEFHELAGLAPPKAGEADVSHLARLGRDYVSQGKTRWVALSLGSEGALLVGKDDQDKARALFAPPLALDVKSVVGAGDSFVGALTLAFARGQSPEDALRQGVAAGSAALLSPGTGLGLATDMDRLANEVQVTALTL